MAEEAWPAIVQAVSHKPAAEVAFAAWVPSRQGSEISAVTRPTDWFNFVDDVGEGPRPSARPPAAQLYSKWRGISETSVFGCEGLVARRKIHVREPMRDPAYKGFGAGLIDDARMVSVPVVSADGASALVYVQVVGRSSGIGMVVHLTKTGDAWSVAGQNPIFTYSN